MSSWCDLGYIDVINSEVEESRKNAENHRNCEMSTCGCCLGSHFQIHSNPSRKPTLLISGWALETQKTTHLNSMIREAMEAFYLATFMGAPWDLISQRLESREPCHLQNVELRRSQLSACLDKSHSLARTLGLTLSYQVPDPTRPFLHKLVIRIRHTIPYHTVKSHALIFARSLWIPSWRKPSCRASFRKRMLLQFELKHGSELTTAFAEGRLTWKDKNVIGVKGLLNLQSLNHSNFWKVSFQKVQLISTGFGKVERDKTSFYALVSGDHNPEDWGPVVLAMSRVPVRDFLLKTLGNLMIYFFDIYTCNLHYVYIYI